MVFSNHFRAAALAAVSLFAFGPAADAQSADTGASLLSRLDTLAAKTTEEDLALSDYLSRIRHWAALAERGDDMQPAERSLLTAVTSPINTAPAAFAIEPNLPKSCTNDCYKELQDNDAESCGDDAGIFDSCHTGPNIVFAACLADCILD
ncbi:hypothetical protein [Marivita sp. GX14005]|uniref:hypothetical protein n=1 Tax=Marivita sp. GX14005 TaxID=2942276 RepID=UPI002018FF62|nr:hypothetical protein [Marivita sp. GX14005]MCL3882862.1 hypothetical protein [Marivita sp. GX14005]